MLLSSEKLDAKICVNVGKIYKMSNVQNPEVKNSEILEVKLKNNVFLTNVDHRKLKFLV